MKGNQRGESAKDSAARIAVLPEVVKNQIAAGEVVERPASIVKELCENALDAGATSVRVDLEEGGAKLVRVSDDGEGMSAEDLELAFVPHATSKLHELADLDHVASLGFRGEALASIGSVARCRITSRRRADATACTVTNEGGRVSDVQPTGGPLGTSVEVRDLFFNTPARRRFLKRTATELSRALDVVQRLALSYEGVGFTATHDGRRVLDVEATMDLAARVRRLFGAELADELVPVEAHEGSLGLTGLVAPPRFARRDTARQMWFLNGRPLRDKLLVRCLKEAYRGVLFEGRHPVAFLSLSLDPGAVDVNVHPAKTEVRFREERRVFGFCLQALRPAVRATDMATPGEMMVDRALRRTEPGARQIPFTDAPGRAFDAAWQDRLGGRAGRPRSEREPIEVYELPRAEGGALDAPDGTVAEPERTDAGRAWTSEVAGRGPYLRVASTYVLRELDDGFEIVDQHALHERVTYEALLAEARAGAIEVQRYLIPELVELEREDVALLDEHAAELVRAGVHLAAMGETTVSVSGLPARLRRVDLEELARGLAGAVRRSGKVPEAATLLEDVLHSQACRSSVMAGDRLTDTEIESLLERAAALEHDQTCPHGRPTRVRFTGADLEKAFLRRP